MNAGLHGTQVTSGRSLDKIIASKMFDSSSPQFSCHVTVLWPFLPKSGAKYLEANILYVPVPFLLIHFLFAFLLTDTATQDHETTDGR